MTERLMKIVDKMVAKQMGQLPADQQQMAQGAMKDQMDQLKASIQQQCTEQKWSQELIDCVDGATDGKGIQACEKYAPAQPAQPAEPAPTEAKPVAEWTGGHECKDVGERMRQLTLAQVGDIPDDQKADIDKALDDQVASITKSCTDDAWSDAWRDCIVHAPDMDAVSGCFQ
jgi:hypothetical protein